MPAETHGDRSPLDRDEVARLVREQLAEILEIDADAITLDARLREDLDADDFALHRPRRGARGGARRAHGRLHHRRRRPRRAAARSATRSTTSSRGSRRALVNRGAERIVSIAPLERAGRARSDARCRTSTTRRCSTGRSRTARGAPRTAKPSRTSGSSSSATRCSASSSPTTCSSTSRTCPKGSSPKCGPAS